MTNNINNNRVPIPDDDLASPITLISIWATLIIISPVLMLLVALGIYHLLVCG